MRTTKGRERSKQAPEDGAEASKNRVDKAIELLRKPPISITNTRWNSPLLSTTRYAECDEPAIFRTPSTILWRSHLN